MGDYWFIAVCILIAICGVICYTARDRSGDGGGDTD